MIYTKTEMWEMPKYCYECDCYIFNSKLAKENGSPCLCGARNQILKNGKTPPKWCPLVEVKEADEK